jgi:Domain of unknown function (DUF4440)
MTGNLKRIATILALSLVAETAGTTAQEPPSDGNDSVHAVRNLEQRWLDSEDAPDALEAILADDFVHVLPMGFIGKRDQIDYLRKHPRSSRSAKHFDQLRVRIYGSTAIANGIVSELPKGGAAAQETIFTDVFVKRQGVWQAVNAQELPLNVRGH